MIFSVTLISFDSNGAGIRFKLRNFLVGDDISDGTFLILWSP